MEEQPIRLGKGGPEIASPLGMGLWSWGDSYVSFWCWLAAKRCAACAALAAPQQRSACTAPVAHAGLLAAPLFIPVSPRLSRACLRLAAPAFRICKPRTKLQRIILPAFAHLWPVTSTSHTLRYSPGLQTWGYGHGGYDGSLTSSSMQEAYQAALQAGCNLFDTAESCKGQWRLC